MNSGIQRLLTPRTHRATCWVFSDWCLRLSSPGVSFDLGGTAALRPLSSWGQQVSMVQSPFLTSPHTFSWECVYAWNIENSTPVENTLRANKQHYTSNARASYTLSLQRRETVATSGRHSWGTMSRGAPVLVRPARSQVRNSTRRKNFDAHQLTASVTGTNQTPSQGSVLPCIRTSRASKEVDTSAARRSAWCHRSERRVRSCAREASTG